MRRAFLPLLILASVGVAPNALSRGVRVDDTFALVHKRVAGETQSVTMKIEGKFAEMAFSSTTDLAMKVTEVAEDGGYTIETTAGDTKTVVNGQEMPADSDDSTPKVRTSKYDAKGKEIKEAGDEDEDEDDPTDLAFDYEPSAPVKIGESWTPEKKGKTDPLVWTLTGKEELNGKEVLVVEGKGKGPNDEKIESKVWVDPVTFIGRKATATISGIKQEEGSDGEMTISIEEKA